VSAEIPSQTSEVAGWRRLVRDGENLGVTLTLFAMMLLPLAAMIVRKQFAGAAPLVQHLTLLVGVLGGAIAARENRLLALSSLTAFLKGRWKTAAAVISGAFGATVSLFLCVASVQFVREAGADISEVLAFGIRTRWVQWMLPVGFGLVALRLLWHVSEKWSGRLVALALFVSLVLIVWKLPVSPEKIRWPAIAVLLVATLLGAPVFTTLGGLALILFWSSDNPIAAIPVTHYSLVVNPSLPTIPLFTLAGYFLAEGGASRRLVRVFNAMFGGIRGGPAIVTALVCAFFTSFTGASGVTILALGGLLMPVLIGARYSEQNALGLLTGAGSLGLLFPPCLPLILYAIISTQAKAPVTIDQMFLGGIVPGCLLVGLTAWWGVAVGPKREASERRYDVGEALAAVRTAKWELLLPVVALVALFGGFATPVEAAAVTALYAFIVETFVYRDLKFCSRDAGRGPAEAHASATVLGTVTECGLLVGGVLLILGVANGFTNYLVDAEIPSKMVEWTKASIHSPWMFLLLLNLFLLGVGCLMDIYSAIVVVVPLIVPIGKIYGINPVHLGIIFLANLELGYLTPPVGMNLFLSSYRFRKPMATVTRAVLPMLCVLLAGVLLITYIPAMTTTLPRLFGHK
jgi:tripartite ATP-independent transporter DctM subunit